VFLALSFNAFTQIKRQPSINPVPTSKITEYSQHGVGNEGWRMTGIPSEKNHGKIFERHIPEHDSLIQVYDSIFYTYFRYNEGFSFDKLVNIVYDANNNITGVLEFHKTNGSAWDNGTQYAYAYDAGNNLISELDQNQEGGKWVNFYQRIYTYDAKNNLINELDQNRESGKWVNYYMGTYSYDADNNCKSALEQYWRGGKWENSYLGTYTYDGYNNLIYELYHIADGNSWINSSQRTNNFDVNNNMTSTTDQEWYDDTWVNSTLQTYTYDINHNLSVEFYQSWQNGEWSNADRGNFYSYDENNFLLKETHKQWNADSVVFLYDLAKYFFHTVYTGISDIESTNITVYPNPSNGKFIIKSNGGISSIEIYNVTGKRIYSDFKFSKQTSNEIDLSNCTKGIYFLRISAVAGNYTSKIIIQ
jgi:Secretion system C-terminal sorting domain